DGVNALTHTGGQIIRLNNLAPTDASNAVTVDYITPRSTRFPTPAAKVPPVDHSGFFRNPLPTTDGLLIASHTNTKVVDTPLKNGMISTASNYNFRLVTMKQSIGTTMTPDVLLTPGLKANISYTYFINGARLTQQFNGTLWEMDAVELVSRNTPAKREAVMDEQERSIFAEERVDINTFKRYLEANDRALIISRDVTMRDKDDRLQPFNLRVTGTQKQSPPAQAGSAPLTEVSDVLFFQADYIRSYADVLNPTTAPFRRIQPVKMHDVMNREFSTVLPTTPKSSSVKIQKDGSFAAFVPAHRAISWQLNNTQGSAVVRERYWLNFKAGEIRACVKCHGENQSASALYSPTPTNKPEALRGLLGVWKQDNYPKRIQQTVPLHQSLNVSFPVQLEWMPDTRAKKYEVTLRAVEGSGSRIVYTRIVDAPVTTLTVGQNELAGTSAAQYTWDVRGVGEWGVSETIQPFTFSTNSVLSVGDGGDSPELSVSPNPASSEVRVRFPVSEPQTVTLVMVDMIGRDVITSSLAATGDVDTRIPADQLPNGIYTLRVVQTHGEYRKRIVITR
ncbi:MAG: T9SS type A sorting domain-containing protein, partial [Candidatus Kapabacteria bacterium]|nr:T9SS type A sorting domain-containing protein [Candidatus Kapabacteria bacterium]